MGNFILKCLLGFVVSLSIYWGVLTVAMSAGSGASQQANNLTEVAKWAFSHALFYSIGTTVLIGISFLLKRLSGNFSYVYIPFLLIILTFMFVWTRNLSQPLFGAANLQVAGVLFLVFLLCLCIIWAGDRLVGAMSGKLGLKR